MLVLSRRAGESVMINGGMSAGDEVVLSGNITIKIVEITRGMVRLGIEAPREIRIFRNELVAEQAIARQTKLPQAKLIQAMPLEARAAAG